MKKLTISFLGRDCPGIVSAVSQILGQTGCNIIEVTQTILCGEFAAIFIVQAPENVTEESLHTQLALGLVDAKLDLSVLVRPAVEGRWEDSVVSQPFVVTVDGPDRPGLIAAMSRVFARHGVNIDSLKAVLGQDVRGQGPRKCGPRPPASRAGQRRPGPGPARQRAAPRHLRSRPSYRLLLGSRPSRSAAGPPPQVS